MKTGCQLFFCVGLFAFQPVFAEPQVFTGTLGKAGIVMALDSTESGRYFYTKYRKDIFLEKTTSSDDELQLTEGTAFFSNHEVHPHFSLRRDGDGWRGEWISGKDVRLPVVLSPAKVSLPVNGGVTGKKEMPMLAALHQKGSLYDELRYDGVKLQQTRREQKNGYQLGWWRDPLSGVAIFQIESGYTPEEREAVNQYLQKAFWDMATDYHQCMMYTDQTGVSEFSVTVRFLSPQFLSYTIFSRYDCGGAHPDEGMSAKTLQIKDARKLTLEDFLWVGELPVPPEEKVSGSDYVFSVFPEWMVKTLTGLYPQQMRTPEDLNDACDYSDRQVWDNYSWYLTPKGIHFYPYFPRVSRYCDRPEWSVLPWNVIKQHPGRLGEQILP